MFTKNGPLMLACIAILMLAKGTTGAPIPSSRDYGQVVLDIFARKAGIAPVVFDHWLHRAQFTCRLCHVDIGFAMQAGASGINAERNAMGYDCGTCHDGKRMYEGRQIFAACTTEEAPEAVERCKRCHSWGQNVEPVNDFDTVTAGLPRQSPGNVIDWEAAEEKGLIQPLDFLEGVSIERQALQPQEDFTITAKAAWVSDVIFSHKKHAVWNGCELCHPEIFASTKRGTAKYTMFQLIEGEYCGVCHTKVAFSVYLCKKCHTDHANWQ